MGKECTHELNYCACAFDDLMSRRAAVDREALAELCHKQWSNWMRYLFGKTRKLDGGYEEMPVWAVDRWKRQMETPYAELSEEEKESDRREADKFLDLIAGVIRMELPACPNCGDEVHGYNAHFGRCRNCSTLVKKPKQDNCHRDTDGDGNCHVHPRGCPIDASELRASLAEAMVAIKFTIACAEDPTGQAWDEGRPQVYVKCKAVLDGSPSPQATPKCDVDGCVRYSHDNDHHVRADGSSWRYEKPQATAGKECPRHGAQSSDEYGCLTEGCVWKPDQAGICSLCHQPMPAGEEMFKFHGYSGDCPKPEVSTSNDSKRKLPCGHDWDSNTDGGSRPCFTCLNPGSVHAETDPK